MTHSVNSAPVRLTLLRNNIIFSVAFAALLPSVILIGVGIARGKILPTPITLGVAPLLALLLGGGLGVLIYWAFFRAIERTLNLYVERLQAAANGNLNVRVPVPDANTQQQVLAELGGAINRLLERIQATVKTMQSAQMQLIQDTQTILSATEKQILSANEQDAVVTETTATVNEVRATVTETAERASGVAETAQHSVETSRRGEEAVSATVAGMDVIRRRVQDIADNILVLSEHTQQIGEIIATVNNLADQSRMLALNASVEAARAGEEGKGFAVVAMEVRTLADQNREATVQVREILGEIQRATNMAVMVTEEGNKGVDEGQRLANTAGESIRDLSRAIEEAAFAAMQIAASTRQQTIGVDQLTGAMRTIKNATADAINSTYQVQSSARRLQDAAQRLNEAMQGLEV